MMRLKSAWLLLLLLPACQTTPSLSEIHPGPDFQTQAITPTYLRRKLNRWATTQDGDNALRELRYAKFRQSSTSESVLCQEPGLYDQLAALQTVNAYRSQDNQFDGFMQTMSCQPSAPVAEAATQITGSSFTAHWQAVPYATGYQLIIDGGSPIVLGNVLQHTPTGLATTSHTYVVKAITPRGLSPASETIVAGITPNAPTLAPAVNITHNSFQANWNTSANATGYEVSLNEGTPISVAGTSYTFNSLTPSTTYSFKVRAINGALRSNYSPTTFITTTADYTSGLVVYFPFDGNANDASGNNLNGTLVNGPALTTDRLGSPNRAYAFNGLNQFIKINNDPRLSGFSNMTLAAWFLKPASVGAPQSIVAKWFQQINLTPGLPQDTYTISTNALTITGASSNHASLNTGGAFTLNQWNHVVFVHSSTAGETLYLNGAVLANRADRTTPLAVSSNPLLIGAENQNNVDVFWRYFQGSIDQVRLYNRALSAAQVTALYNSGN